MRFLSCYVDSQPTVLLERGGRWVDLRHADPSGGASLKAILAAGPEIVEQWKSLGDAPEVDLARIAYRPVIPDPEKVLCVGLNYADHAAESGAAIPDEPVIFSKLPSALCGHGSPIRLPRVSQQVDYEAELVVVLGRAGRDIPVERAWEHVAGYSCGHDVSARDWQKGKPERQWLLGKSFDTFGPVGPALVTADEVPDPHRLGIRLRRNGVTLQDSSTAQLIFGVDRLIAYISQVCTLRPGDLLFTGTPPGVGAARKPPVFLQPGDQVEVEIEGIGGLSNSVVGP